MLEKIKHKIYSFFIMLFFGMKAADKLAFSNNKEAGDSGKGGIEVQDEEESVYKDLLKGVVTQEVRELRHEMYYSERESHKYKYAGNGLAVKKNDLFSEELKGLENSDGFKVILVQNNQEDTGGVRDALEIGDRREFTIKVERDFIPRFRLEEFANKLVVKEVDNEHVMLDFYTTKYESQFNRRHRPFLNELDNIYQGFKQSDVLEMKEVHFVTFRAWGAPDLVEFSFNNVEFDTIVEYNGDYVLKFFADKNEKNDILNEFYDEIAEQKSQAHEKRKKKNEINLFEVTANKEPEYDVDEANRLINIYNEKE